MSKKGMAFLDAVSAAETRIKGADAGTEPSSNQRAGGFVGSALAKSNRSLDERVAEAERTSTEMRERAEVAEAQLQGASRVLRVDPSRVRRSRFADRHPKAFEDAAFAELCELIIEAGGNTEAGQVRPVNDDPNFDYELASAHRRHAACLKHNLPFKIEVQQMTNGELLKQMYRENTGKLGLSNFERGVHYASLIRDHEFKSGRALAADLGIPQTNVVRLLRYGDLPEVVINAFPDPREIRFEWVDPLIKAFDASPAAIASAAASLDSANAQNALAIFQRLVGRTAQKSVISDGDQVLGRIRTINGCPAIVLRKDAPPALLEEIKRVVASWTDKEARPA